MRKGRDRKYVTPDHDERIKAIWVKRMAECEHTPAFIHACAVTCFEISPIAKFTEMPDSIRFAAIPDSVTPDQLKAELLLMGFSEDNAEVLSREPKDFTIQGKRITLKERNEMLKKGLTYVWRRSKSPKH